MDQQNVTGFFMNIIDRIKAWYYGHFQKTIATVLGGFALIDLTSYSSEIETWLGHKGYALLRLVGAAGIVWRALQAKHP